MVVGDQQSHILLREKCLSRKLRNYTKIIFKTSKLFSLSIKKFSLSSHYWEAPKFGFFFFLSKKINTIQRLRLLTKFQRYSSYILFGKR